MGGGRGEGWREAEKGEELNTCRHTYTGSRSVQCSTESTSTSMVPALISARSFPVSHLGKRSRV